MTDRYLLDTNIAIAILEGELSVRNQLGVCQTVYLPCIALGELLSARVDENIARLQQLARITTTLQVDESTAKNYGTLKHLQRMRGRPLPDNDLWIAALAQQFDLTLVTRDSHFAQIEDLSVVRW
jgi:tRNA(fMet)-specific endonuclease VapC